MKRYPKLVMKPQLATWQENTDQASRFEGQLISYRQAMQWAGNEYIDVPFWINRMEEDRAQYFDPAKGYIKYRGTKERCMLVFITNQMNFVQAAGSSGLSARGTNGPLKLIVKPQLINRKTALEQANLFDGRLLTKEELLQWRAREPIDFPIWAMGHSRELGDYFDPEKQDIRTKAQKDVCLLAYWAELATYKRVVRERAREPTGWTKPPKRR